MFSWAGESASSSEIEKSKCIMGLYHHLQANPQQTRNKTKKIKNKTTTKNSEAKFPKECHPRNSLFRSPQNSLSDLSSTSFPRSQKLLTYRNKVEFYRPSVLRIQMLEYLCGGRTGGVNNEGVERQIAALSNLDADFCWMTQVTPPSRSPSLTKGKFTPNS